MYILGLFGYVSFSAIHPTIGEPIAIILEIIVKKLIHPVGIFSNTLFNLSNMFPLLFLCATSSHNAYTATIFLYALHLLNSSKVILRFMCIINNRINYLKSFCIYNYDICASSIRRIFYSINQNL